jgi:hypothetical protein
MFAALFFVINAIFCVTFWKSADIAFEEGRPIAAYIQLFLSALCGTLVLTEIY